MNDKVNSSSPTSHLNQVKAAKEALLKNEEPSKIELIECGLENPCNFGIHNPNFDKHNIVDNKRIAK